jgi:hypothetical protein
MQMSRTHGQVAGSNNGGSLQDTAMTKEWQVTILTHSALIARVAAEIPGALADPRLSVERALAILGSIDRCSIAMATLQAHAADDDAGEEVQEAAETLFAAWRALADAVSDKLDQLRRRSAARRSRGGLARPGTLMSGSGSDVTVQRRAR